MGQNIVSSFIPWCTFVVLPTDITLLQNDIKSLLVARLHRVEQQVVVFLALKQGNVRERENQENFCSNKIK